MTSIYGEFFLADVIQVSNENNHTLVAEVDGRAVGLMSVTDEIDTGLLKQCFDLSLYDDFEKEATPEQMALKEKARARKLTYEETQCESVFQQLANEDGSKVKTATVADHLSSYVGSFDIDQESEDAVEECFVLLFVWCTLCSLFDALCVS